MWFSAAVRQNHHLVPVGFITVGDSRRNLNEHVVVFSQEDLLQTSLCRRFRPDVIKNQLCPARQDSVVNSHRLMDMPGLDGSRPRARKVDLSKTNEMLVSCLEHVHDLAALVNDLTQLNDLDPVNHDTVS